MRKQLCMLLTVLTFLFALSAYAAADTIMLPQDMQIVEEETFAGDTSLELVVLPAGVTRIESRAFADSSLYWINLPATLEYIADDAFGDNVRFGCSLNTYAYDWARDRYELQIPDIELGRAIDIGLAAELHSELDHVITFGDCARILNTVLEINGAAPLGNWQYFFENARDSEETMTRREGMVAVYLAAESLGPNYYGYNNLPEGYEIFNEISSVDSWGFWDDMNAGDYSLFPNVWTDTLNGEGSYTNAGYFYSMQRASTSGQTIFDYDRENKTMNPAGMLSGADLLLAAVRLHDSYIDRSQRSMTEADYQILESAEVRRAYILGSGTSVDVSGTCYYVAVDGNDSNDGRSPQRPWATLNAVNEAALNPGDGVFFRRGDIWRGALLTQDGVTYSAYGEGAKPGIYGSPENGAGGWKWRLMDGTSNIWIFYQDMMDCGDIVVNGSDMELFDRAPVWWTGSRYVRLDPNDNYNNLISKPTYNPAANLQNHQYFNDIDYGDLGSSYPIYVYREVNRTGTLYLRCDEGNPGEIFGSIEFCCDPYNGSLITSGWRQDVVLDNLCVRYCGHAMEFYDGSATVQYCEVGYIGAMMHTFYEYTSNYSGDGINHGNNMFVHDNYVHHTYNSGIAPGELSFDPSPDYAGRVEIQGNSTYCSNLLEYTAGIVLINWEREANPNHRFENIYIEDNYVLYSRSAGDATQTKAKQVLGSLVFCGLDDPLPCANENLQIKSNIFYCSEGPLIISGMPPEYIPFYWGNTFAQYGGMPFFKWRFADGNYKPVFDCPYTDMEGFIAQNLGDYAATVVH